MENITLKAQNVQGFVYLLSSSKSKQDDTQILFLIQQTVEHQRVW